MRKVQIEHVAVALALTEQKRRVLFRHGLGKWPPKPNLGEIREGALLARNHDDDLSRLGVNPDDGEAVRGEQHLLLLLDVRYG